MIGRQRGKTCCPISYDLLTLHYQQLHAYHIPNPNTKPVLHAGFLRSLCHILPTLLFELSIIYDYISLMPVSCLFPFSIFHLLYLAGPLPFMCSYVHTSRAVLAIHEELNTCWVNEWVLGWVHDWDEWVSDWINISEIDWTHREGILEVMTQMIGKSKRIKYLTPEEEIKGILTLIFNHLFGIKSF